MYGVGYLSSPSVHLASVDSKPNSSITPHLTYLIDGMGRFEIPLCHFTTIDNQASFTWMTDRKTPDIIMYVMFPVFIYLDMKENQIMHYEYMPKYLSILFSKLSIVRSVSSFRNRTEISTLVTKDTRSVLLVNRPNLWFETVHLDLSSGHK